MKKFILMSLLVLLPAIVRGQARMYTKKARLEDFSVRTTKVVADGESLLAITLREEIIRRWRISPYEFCTSTEYNSLKSDNSMFFLSFTVKEGIVFLSLSRGGMEGDEILKRPFEIVSVPVASSGAPSGQELSFMGAFIDIIQNFTEDAMQSDRVGYAGLASYGSSGSMKGRDILLESGAADKAMISGTAGTAAGIVIAPESPGKGMHCYRMLIGSDNHELYYFTRDRFTREDGRAFTAAEKRTFISRNGNIVR